MSDEIPDHLNPTHDPERERELRAGQAAMLAMNDQMVAAIEGGKTRYPDRADWDDFLARLARIRRQILAWNSDSEEMDDFILQFQTLFAEIEARVARGTSILMEAIAHVPEEKLADLSEQERVRHFDVVRSWEEKKEKILSILPIEERKRIEGE